MATWLDVFYLILTIGTIAGIAFIALYVYNGIQNGLNETKNRLAERGVDISKGGMSVKTNKRMDREDYLDSTQRGLMNAYKNASITKRTDSSYSKPLSNSNSSGSPISPSESEKKHRKKWSLKNTLSGGSLKQ
ncbi:hypothetical protein DL96DRAFT_1603065 [Flagelloscypha sp. PMI_526]|nr:hypothetical protein DL96DRAFT_1603065 [Flagelloscypha sp. PMI_526]